MQISSTLSSYIARQFALWITYVFLALVSIITLFDSIEMMRRASGKADVGLGIVISMSLLKLPHLVQQTMPFCILFAATMAFWRLARSNELVVVRAAGISAWHFLFPAIGVAMAAGILLVTLFNPFASVMLSKFEQLESQYLKRSTSLLSVSKTGLWLRQANETGQSVIHAARVSQQNVELGDVIIFLFEDNDKFRGRIDAESARLRPGFWDIQNAWITAPNKAAQFKKSYRIDTDLTENKILDSFASPQTMSFWDLPGFIETLEAAGFSGHRHKLYWHSLLASPLLLGAMVLIAAIFSLRITRRSSASIAVTGAVFCGFILYFFTDIIYALGLSSSIPVMLAAWTPAGVSILLGLSVLFHVEDG
jgi:lipopolysaccharide export system permease protein